MPADRSVYITRTASFLPNAPVDNDHIEDVLGMVGGRPSRARRLVLRNNGIRSRHYAIDPATGEPTHTNAQLAAAAIRGLAGDGFALDAIDCLATGTSCPDQLMPGHAVMVHGELAIPPCETISTAGICVSGVNALKYAWLAVLAGQSDNAVAAGSELSSAGLHARNFEAECEHRVSQLENNPEIAFEKDFLRWMLSDGAGAFLLQAAPRHDRPSLRIDWLDILSQANRMEVCMYAGAEKQADGSLRGWQRYSADERARLSLLTVKQDVRLLNSSVVEETIGKSLARAIDRHGIKPEDFDWFLPHISSAYFARPLAEYLDGAGFHIPADKWFTNLYTRGNTGSASIFIMVDELLKSGRLQDGQRLLCFIPESGRFTGALMQLTVVAP